MNVKLPTATREGEAGFGLVEIVVATFVLGMIAIAILPLLILGMTTAASQSTVATANQLVSAAIDEARLTVSAPPPGVTECDALAALTWPAHTDGRGVNIQVTATAGTACGSFTAPGTMTYIVTASNAASGVVLSRASTLIYIPAPLVAP